MKIIRNNKARGFTILEMILVIAIMSALLGIIIFSIRPAKLLEDTKIQESQTETELLKTAIESYAAFNNNLPTSFNGLVSGTYYICTKEAVSCPADGISLDEIVEQRFLFDVPVIDTTDPNLTGYKLVYNAADSTIIGIYTSDYVIAETTLTPTPTSTPTPTPTPAPTPDPILGTGDDGSITVSSASNLNTTNLIAGRSCADGGDAVNYSVTALTADTATLSTSPSAGCLNAGDEILIINLKGISANYTNVGNYETLRVLSVSTSTVTFSSNKTKYYGNGVSDDTNLGTASTNQIVILQRIPNYTDLTVQTSNTLTVNPWNGIIGGVLFIRANGTVTVDGIISVNAIGYVGGNIASQGGCSSNSDGPGYAGETYNGFAYKGYAQTTSLGSAGGGGNSTKTVSGLTGSIGGGGGGGAWNYGWVGGRGGGAGYGTVGAGANPGSGTTGGNGSGVHGGGGGTYGTPDLTSIMLGSAGGGGDFSGNQGPCPGGIGTTFGGNGGGIIVLGINNLTVATTGSITSNGDNSTYGGGGAGGSIRIFGNNITLGTNKVTATGGTSYYSGGVGRIAISSPNISGTTNPAATIVP